MEIGTKVKVIDWGMEYNNRFNAYPTVSIQNSWKSLENPGYTEERDELGMIKIPEPTNEIFEIVRESFEFINSRELLHSITAIRNINTGKTHIIAELGLKEVK